MAYDKKSIQAAILWGFVCSVATPFILIGFGVNGYMAIGIGMFSMPFWIVVWGLFFKHFDI